MKVRYFLTLGAVCIGLAAGSPGKAAAQPADTGVPQEIVAQIKALREQHATAYREGGYERSLEASSRVVAIVREHYGARSEEYARSITVQARDLQALGRLGEAEPLFAEALRLRRELLGDRHAATLVSFNYYGLVLESLGRLSEAALVLAEALRLKREVLGERHPSTITALNNYAFVLVGLGKANEAEPLYAEALRLSREVLGERHPGTLNKLNNYASVLSALGRIDEAELLYAESLRLSREVLGNKHPDLIGSLSNHAVLLSEIGRNSEAVPLLREALKLSVELLGERHPTSIGVLGNYIGVLMKLGRIKEAEELQMVAITLQLEVQGVGHPATIAGLINYAYLLEAIGRTEQAETIYSNTLPLSRDVLGEAHPKSRIVKADLALTRIKLPSRSHLAVEPARSLVNVIRDAREVAGYTPSEEAQLGREEQSQAGYFGLFANAAWSRGPGLVAEARAAGAKPLNASDQNGLREEVFTALQDALASAAGKAISASVARKAAGPLEPLAIEREQLSQEWVDTDKALVGTLGESGGASDDKLKKLRAQLAMLEARMNEIDQRLREEAPEYFALIRPEALALAKAQEVLASDEAALMVVPTNHGTHIMLVTDEELRWARSDWNSKRIDAAVNRLLWDVGAEVDVSSADAAVWGKEGSGTYPFAFDRAHALYRELIKPIAQGLKGKKHVFISASGSLSSLPFGLLVSEIPEGDNGDPDVLRSAKWFADAYAIVLIPTLQSLEFLRKYRASNGKEAGSPFLGIGDPVLAGESQTRGSRRSAAGAARRGGGGFKRMFDGSLAGGGEAMVNLSALRNMARLPGTAIELKAMWEEFGKPADALHLADQATESFVRTRNLDAGIIAFATHGLLAGDIDGTAEPGLVLTPPSQASESNDGYLSASEISALKLNADWVILSACNTAAGDGSEGAPGLSGLARSFFYAGARNLLASHWPVRDDVAARLTVRTISIARENPQLSRAQAFQLAMQEIRNDKLADSDIDTWAHPSAWAPFSLIGDGAR